jgi:hypothetical protein
VAISTVWYQILLHTDVIDHAAIYQWSDCLCYNLSLASLLSIIYWVITFQ